MQKLSSMTDMNLSTKKKHLRVKNGSTLEAEQEEQDTCFMALVCSLYHICLCSIKIK